MPKIVTLLSGGIDSITMLYHLKAIGVEQLAMFIDYGQPTAIREFWASQKAARCLDLELLRIRVEGLYEFSGVGPNFIVPNRNATLACMAAAVAVGRKYQGIALGVQGGDRAVYTDCRPGFIEALDSFLSVATGQKLSVITPFLFKSKAQILWRGQELGVPYKYTWSCYAFNRIHCGRCPACQARKFAFYDAGIEDLTSYRGGLDDSNHRTSTKWYDSHC